MADSAAGSASKGAASNRAADLDAVLLEVLACPVCHGRLVPVDEFLDCAACECRYPVRDGVPVLLSDEAVPRTTTNDTATKDTAR